MSHRLPKLGSCVSGWLFPGLLALAVMADPAPTLAGPICAARGEVPSEVRRLATEFRDDFTFRHGWVKRTERAVKAREDLEQGRLSGDGVTRRGVVDGTIRLPVILAKFSSGTGSPPDREDIELLLFGDPPNSTLKAYYDEISYGNLEVTGVVYDWATLPNTSIYYTDNSFGLANRSRRRDFIRDAVDPKDAVVDFGQFDNDGPDNIPNSGDDDGYVDCLVIMHAQNSGACGSNDPTRFWSHVGAFSASNIGGAYNTDDPAAGGGNIKIDEVMITAAVGCAGAASDGIGTIAHELGHCLGLPDLYDGVGNTVTITCSDDPSTGIGGFGLMGAANSNVNAAMTPVHMSAWSKARLGWISPGIVTTDQINVLVNSATTSPVAYKLWTHGNPDDEYFLLEARTQEKYDLNLPGEGILIYHVNEGGWDGLDDGTDVNASECNPLIDVESRAQTGADHVINNDDLAQNGIGSPATVWCTGSSFGPVGTPSSVSYSGYPTSVSVSIEHCDTVADSFRVSMSVGVAPADVDLCVLDCPADACSEPTSCDPWWVSPSAWIDKDEDGEADPPAFGYDNTFKIQVRNHGSEPAENVAISMYYWKPAISLTPWTMNLLGQTTIPIIDAFSEGLATLTVPLPVPDAEGSWSYAVVIDHAQDPVPPLDDWEGFPTVSNNVALLSYPEFWGESASSAAARSAGTGPGFFSAVYCDVANYLVPAHSCSVEVTLDGPPETDIPTHFGYDINPTNFRLDPGEFIPVEITLTSGSAMHGDRVRMSVRATCLETMETVGGVRLRWFIDDHEPEAPSGVSAKFDLGSIVDAHPGRDRVQIAWDDSGMDVAGMEEQISYWEVHYGPVPGFIPAPTTLERIVVNNARPELPGMHAAIDVPGNQPNGFYKIVAVDRVGHHSDASGPIPLLVIPPDGPTGSETPPFEGVVSMAPNPSGLESRIAFSLAESGRVEIQIFDLEGRRVRQWRAGFEAGNHEIVWDHRGERGRRVTNGVYWVRIATPAGVTSRKLTVIR